MEDTIGEGGFGVVLAGRRENTNERVAIKLARDDTSLSALQLRREIAALQAIGPPAVPAVYQSGTVATGTPYVVMEYVPWSPLDRLVASRAHGLDVGEFGPLALAICDAVAAVHRAGFCHCDLKPDNVFTQTEPPVAKLVDFGLVRRPGADSLGNQALNEFVLGTATYLSPEQCEGGPQIDTRSDIYSLGVVFYQMLTGQTPFSGTRAELYQAHLNRRPPRPSRFRPVPEKLEAVLMRCLAKPMDHRFYDAAELRRALASALFHAENSPQSGHTEVAPQVVATAARASAERRPMAHLFFTVETQFGDIKELVEASGGTLAHLSGRRGCAVFDPDGGKEPITRPLRAARSLTLNGLCQRVVIDIGSVELRRRQNRPRRYRSPLFRRADRFPRASDPPGVLLSRAALDLARARNDEPELIRDGLWYLGRSTEPVTSITCLPTGSHELIGRRDVLDKLLTRARDAAKDRKTTLTAVIAEPGHGKSHLATALLGELTATLEEAQIIDICPPEPVAGNVAEVQRALLLRAMNLPATIDSDGIRERFVALLGYDLAEQVWPAVAYALGLVARDAPELRRLAAVPGGLHDALVRAVGSALRSLASQRALCLVIDDAQFLDEATLDALEYATRMGTDLPLWVCVLARPSFEDMRPEWGQSCARSDIFHLEPLGRDDAATLCRHLLLPAENVPSAAIDSLVERTRGIPLLLVELIRGLKRERLIRRHERGDMWFVATDELDKLPDLPLVEWLTQRELSSLPEDLANHARMLALLGADFDRDEVEAIMEEIDRMGLSEALPLPTDGFLRRLVATRLLVRHRDDRLRFRHALVRDSIAAAVPRAMAEQIHRAAYRYYRSTGSVTDKKDDTRLARLALHAAESGLREEACSLYLTLAQRAADGQAYLLSEQLFSRVLDLVADAEVASRYAASKGRGAMRYRLGRYQDSLADLDAAGSLAPSLGCEAEIHVLLDEATVLDWTNDYRKSEQRIHVARELAEYFSSPLIEARLLLGTGRSHLRFGRVADACEALQAASNAAEVLDDEGYETLVISLLLLTYVLPLTGRIEDTERAFERLLRLCEERDDRMHLAVALLNRRVLRIARGEIEQAVQDGLRGIELGRDLGVAEVEYIGEFNLGELLYLSGDFDAARPHVERAVELESRRPSGAGRPMAELLMARLLAFEGKYAPARAIVDRLETQQNRARSDGHTEALFLPSEQLLFAMVDLVDRDADDSEWQKLRLLSKRAAVEQERIEVIEMHGLWLMQRGRYEEAARAFAEAVAASHEMPNAMGDRLNRHLACPADATPPAIHHNH
ncbi:MAG: protein kinase [Proteobacteria bacterium]|nr:protein kinase [Pseudomonadota bacterium]